MLDFRIHTFLCVCEQLNYTKAAEILNITQPAVSQHIRYLEEKYDTKFFTFTGKKMKLTVQGERFYRAALQMRYDEADLMRKLKLTDETPKEITFGATLTIGEFALTKRLTDYIKAYPTINLNMRIANTNVLLEQLDQAQIDFALVEGSFIQSQYGHLTYDTVPFIAVCAPHYPWRTIPQKISDLLSETILIREKGSGSREILETFLQSQNLAIEDFSHRIEMNHVNVIKKLTLDGCGITFIYETAVKEELEQGLLIKLPIEHLNIVHDFSFIWRKNSIFSSYYENFFNFLKPVPTP